jgi:hypothetical protein
MRHLQFTCEDEPQRLLPCHGCRTAILERCRPCLVIFGAHLQCANVGSFRGVPKRLASGNVKLEPTRLRASTGEIHEYEDTSNHNRLTAGSRRGRLLWPWDLVLGYWPVQ